MRKKYAVWMAAALLLLTQLIGQKALAADTRILFVNGMHSNKAKVTQLKSMAETRGLSIDRIAQSDLKDQLKATATFSDYDLVIFEAVSVRQSKAAFSEYASVVSQTPSRFMAINWLDNQQLLKGIDSDQAKKLHDYYGNGGVENFNRMLDFLTYNVFGDDNRKIAAPIIYPQVGIYHPNYEGLVFETREDYLQWKKADPKKPIVAVLMQRALIESVQTQVVDEAMAQLEAKGLTPLAFFFELSPKVSDYKYLLQDKGETVADLIINFRNIHWASKRKEEFEALGVPVIQALTYFDGDQKHWEESTQGISPGMTPFVLVLPEAAGVIDPTIVAAIDDESGGSEVIDYQMDYLINKVANWVDLKRKSNTEKRMTVMIWGDRDVGASFLNVPGSLQSISKRLNKEGYNVQEIESGEFTDTIDRILSPFYREFELEKLLQDDLAELMPVEEYLSWFNTLPEHVTKPINDYWGQPKDNFMAVERDGKYQFILPRIQNGNMLIMRQPPRADDKESDARLYHDTAIPMNHYYLAAYYYARTYWASDVFIHLGTHGSQEYLSGKERGLSRYDQGNLAVWDTPVLYPYIVDDVGEAMQSKRRGSATMFAHMTPPFAAAGLQGEMANIHELMHQYKSMDEGGVKQKTGQKIVDYCISENICDDFEWTQEEIAADFDGFLVAVHEYLEDLSAQNQPLGLHTYGALPEQDLITSTLLQMIDRKFSAWVYQFEKEYFAIQGGDGESDHSHSNGHDEHDHHADGNGDFEKVISQVAGEDLDGLVGFKTLRAFAVERTASREELDDDLGLEEDAIVEIVKAQALYQNLKGIKELDHLIDGLAGKYIPVKNGGDPIRHPDAVPTGFNLYGFDPSRVPTQAAFEQGKELTEGVITDYYDKHGVYPDKLAFSLWSIETMRHYGVLEAQALYTMGVRPQWSPDGRVIGTEIIPAAELKRPRVDVVLSATGLYRDAFPNVMQLLAKAVEQVAELKEESNFVWRNSQRVKSELIAEGVEEQEAAYLSTVRLFSNASGNFGSGVDGPVFNSDTWDSDAKIANNYMAKMGFFYGSDNSRWGQRLENINLYGKQLSGTDIALFARSSNLYGMITSDDPFEYFGSLSLAVRNLDGKSPEMMISDLRDANNPKAEGAAKFLAKELRSRNFHKRWVQEMMKEGYSGAVTMSSNLSNFWGWQVVDPNIVRGDQWQEFYEVYVDDKLQVDINEFFERVNPESQAQMLERMLEANRKEYWQADEQALKHIIERYVELAEKYDLFIDNEKLREFVDQQAAGFGLQALPAPMEAVAATAAAIADVEQVEGQKLEKVEQQAQKSDLSLQLKLAFAICLLFIFLGAWRQLRQQPVAPRWQVAS